jgi:hypothetical protein
MDTFIGMIDFMPEHENTDEKIAVIEPRYFAPNEDFIQYSQKIMDTNSVWTQITYLAMCALNKTKIPLLSSKLTFNRATDTMIILDWIFVTTDKITQRFIICHENDKIKKEFIWQSYDGKNSIKRDCDIIVDINNVIKIQIKKENDMNVNFEIELKPSSDFVESI